ncbi:MAG: hypothetical protein HY074_06115 [Deltaproteobacteria bacterium]|nr:hypothetical protein [Deltaproteobacteria bacterium]
MMIQYRGTAFRLLVTVTLLLLVGVRVVTYAQRHSSPIAALQTIHATAVHATVARKALQDESSLLRNVVVSQPGLLPYVRTASIAYCFPSMHFDSAPPRALIRPPAA